jgi:hypothetical protein
LDPQLIQKGSDVKIQRLVPYLLVLALMASAPLFAQNDRNRAPGFAGLPAGAKVAIMPVDVELFSISAGGVLEPKADWTENAQRFMTEAMSEKKQRWGVAATAVKDSDAEEFSELVALQAAIARSISFHYWYGGPNALPTKNGQLDWSLGNEPVKSLQEKTGADYGLFVWFRDSYASGERKVMMVGLALLGVGLPGGQQFGYATLVDLRSGQVMWFNQMQSGTGDVREAEPARNTVDKLLAYFPAQAAKP